METMEKQDFYSERIITITPKIKWWSFDFKELKEYRDLFYFLVLRDIKVMYAQTILGFLWAILQPATQIIIFSVVFGKIAQVSTEGIPYVLFSSIAIIPWTYMSQSLIQSSQSLVSEKHMLGKVYFPRIIYPIVPILSRMVDFSISLVIIIGIAIYFNVAPTWRLVFLPFFTIEMMMIPVGLGMWLSSLAIRYRDVKHAMPFVIRMLMYTAPIVYSASSIPEKYRMLYSLNPLVSVIEGYRAVLLGNSIPWNYVLPGSIITFLIFLSGAMYFRYMERIFVDVI
jgi:lipopolysaccharide transport system permease protein